MDQVESYKVRSMRMRHLIFASALLCFANIIFSHPFGEKKSKPAVNFSVFGKWPAVASQGITNNRNFAFYIVRNPMIGTDSLFISSLKTNWKFCTRSAKCNLTSDNRFAVFQNHQDTIGILKLGTSDIVSIPEVASFLCSQENNEAWIAYQLKNSKKVILYNIERGRKFSFDSIIDFRFTTDGKGFLLRKRSVNNTDDESLVLFQLTSERSQIVWCGDRNAKIEEIVFSSNASAFAFIVQKADATMKPINSVWYFHDGANNAVLIANDRTLGIGPDLSIRHPG